MMYMLSQIPAVVNSGRTRSTTQKVASPSDFCVVRANGRICPHADKSGRVIVEDLLRVTAIREARFARRVGILPLPVGGGGGGGGGLAAPPPGEHTPPPPPGGGGGGGGGEFRQSGRYLRVYPPPGFSTAAGRIVLNICEQLGAIAPDFCRSPSRVPYIRDP